MSLIEPTDVTANQPAQPLDAFITALGGAFREDQILLSGSEYDLYAKDPAVNARKPEAFIFRNPVSRFRRWSSWPLCTMPGSGCTVPEKLGLSEHQRQ